ARDGNYSCSPGTPMTVPPGGTPTIHRAPCRTLLLFNREVTPMRKRSRVPLFVEPLEDRCVPATVQYVNGSLQINAQVNTTLTLTQVANNTFRVQDGSLSLTYTAVSSISVTGTTRNDNEVVNFGTFTYAGTLLINTGNGNDTIDLRANGGGERGNVNL